MLNETFSVIFKHRASMKTPMIVINVVVVFCTCVHVRPICQYCGCGCAKIFGHLTYKIYKNYEGLSTAVYRKLCQNEDLEQNLSLDPNIFRSYE